MTKYCALALAAIHTYTHTHAHPHRHTEERVRESERFTQETKFHLFTLCWADTWCLCERWLKWNPFQAALRLYQITCLNIFFVILILFSISHNVKYCILTLHGHAVYHRSQIENSLNDSLESSLCSKSIPVIAFSIPTYELQFKPTMLAKIYMCQSNE